MHRAVVAVAAAFAALAASGCGEQAGERALEQAPAAKLALDCPVYCAVVMRRCRGSLRQFASTEACQEACSNYPTNGAEGSVSGDTLQCRFTFALAARKTTHYAFCRNAGPSGGVNCR